MKNVFRSIAAGIALGLVAVLLSFSDIAPVQGQQVGLISCSQNVQYDANTNGATRIFTANATSPRQIYICGYTINVGATATNVRLSRGTGTNCGTGTANVTPLWVLPIAGSVSEDSPAWRGLTVPAGNDLCIFTSAGNPVQAVVYYSYQ